MAKYKLSNDYVFRSIGNKIFQNKLNPDGTVKEYVIIDSNLHDVKGQEHKLELIEEAPVLPEKPAAKPEPLQEKPKAAETVSNDNKKNTAEPAPGSSKESKDKDAAEPEKGKKNESVLSKLKEQNAARKQDSTAK